MENSQRVNQEGYKIWSVKKKDKIKFKKLDSVFKKRKTKMEKNRLENILGQERQTASLPQPGELLVSITLTTSHQAKCLGST